jgi:large conductance mechanosensitive channel
MTVLPNRRAATGFMKDFQDFVMKGNVMDLAVGVIIGAAFGKIVEAFTNGIIMPLLNPILAAFGADWRTWIIQTGTVVKDGKTVPVGLEIGVFLGALLDFLIIALALFIAIRAIAKMKRQEAVAPPEPDEKQCPYCFENVPIGATRCRACTSDLSVGSPLM